MARFAPRQIARVSNAVVVNAGALRSWRRANRRSFIVLKLRDSFGAQSCYGIRLGCTQCGKERSKESDEGENKDNDCKNNRIVCRRVKEKRLHETGDTGCH